MKHLPNQSGHQLRPIIDEPSAPGRSQTEHASISGAVLLILLALIRLGFRSVLQARMESMNQKFTPEMREKALRMLDEALPEHANLTSAARHVGGILGMSPETLRVWHRRRAVDAGKNLAPR